MPEERVFLMVRAGAPFVGTVVVSQLWRVPAAAQAVFWTLVTPAGRGLSTATAKDRESEASPPARVPRVRVQVDPAVGAVHDHPGELAAAEKVVLAGTVSVRTTPAAPWLPLLVVVRVKTRVVPGVPVPEVRVFFNESAGVPCAGVFTVLQLLPAGSPAVVVLEQAELVTAVMPAGRGLTRRTANVAVVD